MPFEDGHSTFFMVYRVFGLVPFQFRFESQNNISKDWRQSVRLVVVEHLWYVCLLLAELYMLIHCCMICYNHSIKVSFDIYRTLHFSIVFTIRALLIIITIDSYCKRNVQAKIMNNFCEIDRNFSEKLNLEINYDRLRHQIAISFLITIFIYTVTMVMLVPSYWNESFEQKLLALFVVYPLLKRSLCGSCFITYAIFVKFRIEAMHEILDGNLLLAQQNSIEICLDQQIYNDNEAFEMRRMINLRQIFIQIYDTVQLINNSFKWSISANFPINVFDISVALFSALDRIVKPEHLSVIYISYSWIPLAFHYVFSLVIIIQMANSLNEEANKLAHKIHRIQTCGIKLDALQDFVSEK